MAKKEIDLRVQDELEPAIQEALVSQRRRPELGRYLLQVDRQTKQSYTTLEAAEKAGMTIKKEHPRLQVSVYDPVDTMNTVIEVSEA